MGLVALSNTWKNDQHWCQPITSRMNEQCLRNKKITIVATKNLMERPGSGATKVSHIYYSSHIFTALQAESTYTHQKVPSTFRSSVDKSTHIYVHYLKVELINTYLYFGFSGGTFLSHSMSMLPWPLTKQLRNTCNITKNEKSSRFLDDCFALIWILIINLFAEIGKEKNCRSDWFCLKEYIGICKLIGREQRVNVELMSL